MLGTSDRPLVDESFIPSTVYYIEDCWIIISLTVSIVSTHSWKISQECGTKAVRKIIRFNDISFLKWKLPNKDSNVGCVCMKERRGKRNIIFLKVHKMHQRCVRYYNNLCYATKGQKISEEIYEVIISPKIRTKYCPDKFKKQIGVP